MKLTKKIFKILIVIEGLLFILLAFDVFSMEGTIWEKIGGFLISIIPGLIVIGILYFLWHKEKILGYLLTSVSIVGVFFFGVFEEFPERLGTLGVIGPALFGGLLFIFIGENTKKEE